MGRPSDYSNEIANDICIRCMTKNLYQVSKDEDMPNRDTIYSWLNTHKEFADNYARACNIRREERFEKMEEIVSEEPDVQRARLKIDVVKWQLSKEEPRKYGDKMDVVSDGEKIKFVPILGGLAKENTTDDINV